MPGPSTGRPRLRRDTTLATALAIADAEGLGAVSVRRIARDLGVTPMALYWHFADKDALLDELTDLLVAEIDLTVDGALPWPEQLRALLEALVVVLRAHPCAAALIGLRNSTSPTSLRMIEVTLEILHRGGFSPVQATTVARQALHTTAALVTAQPGAAQPGADTSPHPSEGGTAAMLAALPAAEFPRVVAAAEPLSSCSDPDAYYALGLEITVAGIEAVATRE